MAEEKKPTHTLVADVNKSFFARNITRRDFLNGTSIGMGSMLLGLGAPSSRSSTLESRLSLDSNWYGYGGVGDYRLSHGNTPEVVANAHRLRDLINWKR